MARLSLGWLKPPKVPADGVMSLADHLRELRYRVIFSMVAVTLGVIGCAFFYTPLLDFMLQPWRTAQDILGTTNPDLTVQAALSGVTSPLILALQVCSIGGLILTSPIWLYQMWAYLAPAMLANEKKYAMLFLAAAIPLFLGGVAMGYLILPQAISVMMAFTPDVIPILNILYIDDFLKLMIQLMLVFGIGFLMPVVVVALNLMGVVTAEQLKGARPFVLFGCAIFGAAATPGGDPFSMLALALPMMLLFFIAELICRFNDKRKAKRAGQDLVVA